MNFPARYREQLLAKIGTIDLEQVSRVMSVMQVVLVVMAFAAATWVVVCQASGTGTETTASALVTGQQGLPEFRWTRICRLRCQVPNN